jgi:hypothetical protein
MDWQYIVPQEKSRAAASPWLWSSEKQLDVHNMVKKCLIFGLEEHLNIATVFWVYASILCCAKLIGFA